MAKKLNLTIADPSANDKTYKPFVSNYRQSANVIDRRDGRGEIRASTDMYGRSGVTENTNVREFYEKGAKGKTRTSPNATPVSGSTVDSTTPDDYATSDIGAKFSQTTPNSSRKVDAEEAVRKTHFERN